MKTLISNLLGPSTQSPENIDTTDSIPIRDLEKGLRKLGYSRVQAMIFISKIKRAAKEFSEVSGKKLEN